MAACTTGRAEAITASVDWPVESQSVGRIADFVAGFVSRAGLDAACERHLALALEELLANAVMHGFPDRPTGGSIPPVRVTLTAETDRVTAVFVDQGIPFDTSADRTVPLGPDPDLSRIGKLGLVLIRELFDEVHYVRRDATNVTTLVKRFA